jgi:uncharacterized membrane protein
MIHQQLYDWLKIIHVISASLLFGTGLSTAAYLWLSTRTRRVSLLVDSTKYIVLADWLFTMLAGIIQPITGFAMIYVHGYSLSEFWIWGSIVGYLIAAICWLPVVKLQLNMHKIVAEAYKNHQPLPPQYDVYFKRWWFLGWPAFISLVIVFYLMTNRTIL